MKTLKLLVTLLIFTSTLVSCKCLKNKETMANLENTNWSLVKTADKNYTANDENPNGINLSFVDGIFSSSDGCNRVGGEFKVEKNTIAFDKIRSSRRFCDEEYMVKNGYYVPFHSVTKFEIKENKLFLYQEDGKTLLAEYAKK